MRHGETDVMDNCAAHSAHERAIDQHDKRLDAHGTQLDKLNATLEKLTVIEEQNQKRLDRQDEEMDRHDERIAALEAAPAKRWDSLVNYVVTAAVALVIGIVAGQIGLN